MRNEKVNTPICGRFGYHPPSPRLRTGKHYHIGSFSLPRCLVAFLPFIITLSNYHIITLALYSCQADQHPAASSQKNPSS
jgi:hypothetical protein